MDLWIHFENMYTYFVNCFKLFGKYNLDEKRCLLLSASILERIWSDGLMLISFVFNKVTCLQCNWWYCILNTAKFARCRLHCFISKYNIVRCECLPCKAYKVFSYNAFFKIIFRIFKRRLLLLILLVFYMFAVRFTMWCVFTIRRCYIVNWCSLLWTVNSKPVN